MTEPESQLPDATPNLVRPPRLSRLRRFSCATSRSVLLPS